MELQNHFEIHLKLIIFCILEINKLPHFELFKIYENIFDYLLLKIKVIGLCIFEKKA